MKARLMHPGRDFDLERELPAHEAALSQDLELETLFEAMARGDDFLLGTVRRAVLLGEVDPEAIVYRQQVLADCLERPALVRELYDLTVEAIQTPRRLRLGIVFRDSPDSLLSRSVTLLEALMDILARLRRMAEEHAAEFASDGFTRLFAMLPEELDDEYLQTLQHHLRELRFRRGMRMSAALGTGNKGIGHVVRTPREQRWTDRISRGKRSTNYSFTIPDRDEAGFAALAELRNRGINLVANALGQSTDHIFGFFAVLRAELAFYVGCLNLHEQLAEKGEPTCFPVPAPPGTLFLSARGLYDPCLSLKLDWRAVGNDVDADRKRLVMVTGANQGGKSTFLRSVGLAQLMTQCGMFVAAESFRADLRDGVFTHFKREEDAEMESGKLDEELARMREIGAAVTGTSLLLCNESFASTNEREGSEIARQIVRALTEAGVKICFVTHLFDLAQGFHRLGAEHALFLRAERRPGGRRTFRLVEGEPLPTSYGADSYRRIFGAAEHPALAER